MADEHDTNAPPADTDFAPVTALEPTGVSFESDTDAGASETGQTATKVKDNISKLAASAGDKAKGYAEDGKAKATAALGDFSKLLDEAAGQVDEKFGAQYGQYARSAADYVNTFAQGLESKPVDEIVEDVRGYVQKSPAVALGTAAALGFVIARVLRSGLDAAKTDA